MEVKIPVEQFEHEAREFSNNNMTQFYGSGLFKRDFIIDGRSIKTVSKI